MQCKCFCIEVLSHTSHLYCVLSVARTSIRVTWSQKGNWIVTLLNNQHSNYLFISIDDKVASKLIRILISFD